MPIIRIRHPRTRRVRRVHDSRLPSYLAEGWETTDTPQPETPSPLFVDVTQNVADIIDAVAGRPDYARAVLAGESMKDKPRKTLIAAMEQIVEG